MNLINKYKALPYTTKSYISLTVLIAITVYLTAAAPDTTTPVEHNSIAMSVFFWILNGALLLFFVLGSGLIWYDAIRYKKSFLPPVMATISLILGTALIFDLYTHNVYTMLKQFIIGIL